jgi:hypothetical protein
VILKSPVIGLSSGFRWAEVMADSKETTKTRAENRNILRIINGTPGSIDFGRGNEQKLPKTAYLLKRGLQAAIWHC